MRMNTVKIILLIAMSLLLLACRSSPDDVPSLKATPTTVVEEQPLDDEAKVMAFVECMRTEGMKLKDPVVDADGNVQKPEPVEGITYTREQWIEPYKIGGHHIEGISFGKERADKSELLEKFLTIATCLNEKGYSVDEPTTETIDQWLIDFRVEYEWDDSDATAAYDECSRTDE